MNLSINPEVIWDEVDGVVTLCHTGRVEYFHLDETGGVIWRSCAALNSIESVIAEISRTYPDENTEYLSQEVDQFLHALEDAGLLTLQR